jgi:hypothetical protein
MESQARHACLPRILKWPRCPEVVLLLVTLLFPVALAGQDSTWQAITPRV